MLQRDFELGPVDGERVLSPHIGFAGQGPGQLIVRKVSLSRDVPEEQIGPVDWRHHDHDRLRRAENHVCQRGSFDSCDRRRRRKQPGLFEEAQLFGKHDLEPVAFKDVE